MSCVTSCFPTSTNSNSVFLTQPSPSGHVCLCYFEIYFCDLLFWLPDPVNYLASSDHRTIFQTFSGFLFFLAWILLYLSFALATKCSKTNYKSQAIDLPIAAGSLECSWFLPKNDKKWKGQTIESIEHAIFKLHKTLGENITYCQLEGF